MISKYTIQSREAQTQSFFQFRKRLAQAQQNIVEFPRINAPLAGKIYSDPRCADILKKGTITSDGVYPGTSKRVIHSAEMQRCLMTSAQHPLSIAHERNREKILQSGTYSGIRTGSARIRSKDR